jgi:hypothetical protein
VVRDQIKELKGDEAPGKPRRTGGIKAKPDFGVKNMKRGRKKQ